MRTCRSLMYSYGHLVSLFVLVSHMHSNKLSPVTCVFLLILGKRPLCTTPATQRRAHAHAKRVAAVQACIARTPLTGASPRPSLPPSGGLLLVFFHFQGGRMSCPTTTCTTTQGRGSLHRSVAAVAVACLVFVSGFHGVHSDSNCPTCSSCLEDNGFDAEHAGGGEGKEGKGRRTLTNTSHYYSVARPKSFYTPMDT